LLTVGSRKIARGIARRNRILGNLALDTSDLDKENEGGLIPPLTGSNE